MPVITINGANRVFTAGKTGSGKTHLNKYLLKPIERLVVFDSKGTLRDWNTKLWTADLAKKMVDGENGRLRVLADDLGRTEWTEELNTIWRMRNVTVYIDEAMAIVPPGKRIPNELNRLYTRGREFGIGVWASSQRPAFIPRVMITESEWLIMFRLTMADDRKKMAESGMGPSVLNIKRDKYGFWIMNQEWDYPIYHPYLEVRKVH